LGREHGLPITKLTHEVVTLWYRPPEILLDQEKYSGACDLWGCACIIAEMATKRPLFAGDSEIDQLYQIFQILGTPDENVWPGVSKLPGFQPHFPKWKGKGLPSSLEGKIDDVGIELITQMLEYASNQRITAKAALQHTWFDDVREECIQKIAKFQEVKPNSNKSNQVVSLSISASSHPMGHDNKNKENVLPMGKGKDIDPMETD